MHGTGIVGKSGRAWVFLEEYARRDSNIRQTERPTNQFDRYVSLVTSDQILYQASGKIHPRSKSAVRDILLRSHEASNTLDPII